MKKPSSRFWFVFGFIALLSAVGLIIYDYLQPVPEEAGVFRLYMSWIGAVDMVAGFGALIAGVWLAALGGRRRTGDPGKVALWFKRHGSKLKYGATLVAGLAFGVLTWISFDLPTTRGSRYVLGHEIIRISALVSGVLCLLGILAILLPLVLNLLEGRNFVSFVAARHVRAGKSGFLTIISVLSISGVAVSSCALVSVSAIMGGFGADMQRKILGNTAHITIDTTNQGGFEDWAPVLERVRSVRGVVGATPVVAGEAMGSSRTNTSGTVVRGVDGESIASVIDLIGNIEVGKFEYLTDPERLINLPAGEIVGIGPGGEPFVKGPELSKTVFGKPDKDIDPAVAAALKPPPIFPGVILGRELAKTLRVYVGDEVTLISPMGDLGPMGVMPRVRKFRVAAIFHSGMYEYDASHSYMMIDVARDLFSLGENVTSVDIRAENGKRVAEVTPFVMDAVEREDLRVRDWREMNRNLFSALALERVAAFIVLSIATVIASFCIICTLLLMVTEKGKEIAVLKSLGASGNAIRNVFMLEGIVIGTIGTVFGVLTGIALAVGLSLYGMRIDPDVYYIDRLPIKVDWTDWVLVSISALFICTIATIYPAYAASALRPVESLRNE